MGTQTAQFFNTSNRLIRDVTTGLGRDLKDPSWIGGFCLPMIGSLGHECGGFDLMEEGKPIVGGSLGGISFAQWTGVGASGRRKAFMALCRRLHLHPYSYDAALSMILYELMGSAKGVVIATLKAPALSKEQAIAILGESKGETCDRALLARVVKFEKLYEGAGIKHYPSRYAYALAAKAAYVKWAGMGFPELAKFVMPAARFQREFDAEFGPGTSATTNRFDVPKASIAVGENTAEDVKAGKVALVFDEVEPYPTAVTKPGHWPEDSLSKTEIMAIQTRLRALGYVRVGTVDGKWGTNTRASIAALQSEHAIRVDGHYGSATRQALIAGQPHVVPPERANATAKALFDAGEPTLQAVHPVSIGAKVLAGVSTVGTIVGGVATVWPQASSTLDAVKSSFNDAPGYVWPLLTLVIALYFVITSRKVKAVAVENFRTGANTALATPLVIDHEDDGGVVLPPVPEPREIEGDSAALTAVRRMTTVAEPPMPFLSTEIRTSEPDRPLGVESADDDPVADAASTPPEAHEVAR